MSKRNRTYDKMKNYTLLNKSYAIDRFVENILNKTAQIFRYRNLPDSIPEEILEEFLQTGGNVLFHEVDGTLYVFQGGRGGEPDVYNRPTLYTIANPALRYSKAVKIGEEGVLMKNDNAMQGLLPQIYKYGSILVEADISFMRAIQNTRVANVFSAGDDKAYKSAEEYQRQLEEGKSAIIAESPFLDGVKVHTGATQGNQLSELRETYQFIKSMLYADLGMKVSHNMKRQYVSDTENIIDDDTLLPSIDNMLENRQRALKEVNEMFGTNITVELNSTWELQAEELENALDYDDEDFEDDDLEGGYEDEEQESTETIEEYREEEDGEIEEETVEEDTIEEDTNEEDTNEEDTNEEDTDEENPVEEVEDLDEEVEDDDSNEEESEKINIEVNIINGDDSEINTEEDIDEEDEIDLREEEDDYNDILEDEEEDEEEIEEEIEEENTEEDDDEEDEEDDVDED